MLSSEDRSTSVVNLARLVADQATAHPHKRAVVFPAGRDGQGRVSYTHLTFAQLQAEVEAFARGFHQAGIEPGMKVVLMVRPSLEFLPLAFALFRLGAVPVLIDPGMGRQNLLHCIRQVEPEAFVGIPLAHLVRLLFRRYFRSVRIFVTIGRKYGWGGLDLDDIRVTSGEPAPAPATTGDDLAAIIFTTGSTGPPKGVVYRHGMFCAQVELLRSTFNLSHEDVDMPGFALFALFTVPLGMTVVIPDMDPTRPAQVDPRRILEAVHNQGVTFSFGSPALWNTVSLYCLEHQQTLPTLKSITMAGAPIPGYLHERMLGQILPPGGEIHTPYGATECLPVTSFAGSAILSETLAKTAQGAGYCVGKPLPGITIRIIRISDEPIPRWDQVEELPAGELGEIVVQGPVVSREYFRLPEQTAKHKIYETDDTVHGAFWHRIGDVGYFDEQGRLWFCGRQAHRVVNGDQTWFTVRCEAIFNQHPHIYRSALVGLGDDRYQQTPAIVVEPERDHFPDSQQAQKTLRLELLDMAAANPLTCDIDQIYVHPDFPVDIRHNAKIFREKLARWVATKEA